MASPNSCNVVGALSPSNATNESGNLSFVLSGYPVLMSDNPEDLYYYANGVANGSNPAPNTYGLADSGYGGYYLYADSSPASPGRTRIYHYANNNTGFGVTVEVALYNPNSFAVDIYLNRVGAQAGSNSDPESVGAATWYQWMTGAPNGTDTYQFTLQSGASQVLTNVAVANGYVGNIIADIATVESGTSNTAAITAYLYAYQSAPVAVTSMSAAPLEYSSEIVNGTTYSYGTIEFGAGIRGTFAHSSRTMTYDFSASQNSIYLELYTRPSLDPCSDTPITNEYEQGTDATNGDSVWCSGNYMADYTFTSTLTNDTGATAIYGYVQPDPNCGGSTEVFVLKEDGTAVNCSGPYPVGDAYNYDTSTPASGGSVTHTVQQVLPGGAGGHVQIYWAV